MHNRNLHRQKYGSNETVEGMQLQNKEILSIPKHLSLWLKTNFIFQDRKKVGRDCKNI